MQRELTADQINELFDFVKSKYVRYIDVQYELVDHLATAIEEEMKINAALNFQTALDKVYSRFPITGFDKFVTAKEKAIKKYWLRKVWHIMTQYFTFPKIVLTTMLILIYGSLGFLCVKWPFILMISIGIIGIIYRHFIIPNPGNSYK